MLVTSPRLLSRTAVAGWLVETIGIVPGQTWAFWDRTSPAYRNVASTTEPSLSGQLRTSRAAIRCTVRLMVQLVRSAAGWAGPTGWWARWAASWAGLTARPTAG